MKRIGSFVFTIFFFAFLLALIIFSSKKLNQSSEREKRMLANPPTARFMSSEYKTQFSDWLGDNIFEREFFIDLHSYVNASLFRIKPISDDVEYGKDGWLFYKRDNNIEIAKGTYPVDLEKIARNQQAISDYYRSIGKTYVLAVHPSKVSIYPENLYGNYRIQETPCDKIYRYLQENTDVKVIDIKTYLLKNKQNGLLFWKGDTHFSPLGAYYTYCALMDFFTYENIKKHPSITIDWNSQQNNLGDLRLLLGMTKPFDSQISFEFLQHSDLVSSGNYYDNLRNAYINSYGEEGLSYKFFIFENNNEKDKILILGDSQFQPNRRIPQLLSEHFEKIEYIWNYFSKQEIDFASDANIVVCAIGERAACLLENDVPPYIKKFVQNKLPPYLISNSQFPYNIDSERITANGFEINGWAYYENDDCDVYIMVNGALYIAQHEFRSDVQKTFNLASDTQGFSITIPHSASEPSSYTLYLVNNTKKEIYSVEINTSPTESLDALFVDAEDQNERN